MRTIVAILLAISLCGLPGLPSGNLAAQKGSGRLPDGLAVGGSLELLLQIASRL